MPEANNNGKRDYNIRIKEKHFRHSALMDSLLKEIDVYTARYDYNYVEVIGVLDIIKMHMHMERLDHER